MAIPADQRRTVAVLHPGEMGAALAACLRDQGFRVVCTLAGRSRQTADRARSSGIEVLPDLPTVIETADVVFSVVPPDAAWSTAMSYASCRHGRQRTQIYVDLNSINPETATCIARLVAETGADFVDGAVHGLADRLQERGKIYLSGEASAQVVPLFAGVPVVKVLGSEPGLASALRMLITGMTKGIIALFVEVALAAKSCGLLDELLDNYRSTYPGVMEVVERLLPTYPKHAARRSGEVQELVTMLRSIGLEPPIAAGSAAVIAAIAAVGLDHAYPDRRAQDWSIEAIIDSLHQHRMLQTVSRANETSN